MPQSKRQHRAAGGMWDQSSRAGIFLFVHGAVSGARCALAAPVKTRRLPGLQISDYRVDVAVRKYRAPRRHGAFPMLDGLLCLPGGNSSRTAEDAVKVRRPKRRGLARLFVVARNAVLLKDNLSALSRRPHRSFCLRRGTVSFEHAKQQQRQEAQSEPAQVAREIG